MGREAVFRSKLFKLGREVEFAADDPTIEEWRRLFRVLFASGGIFAHGVSYLEFLRQHLSPTSENEKAAHALEIGKADESLVPRTQNEMRCLLEGSTAGAIHGQQMDLFRTA